MLFLINLSKKFKKYIGAFGLVAILTFTFNTTDLSLYLGANVLGLQSHAPFDGTVYPYEKTVDWTELTNSEREMSFNDIRASKLSDAYDYNERNLGIDFQDLDFSSAESNKIRNEKITYSVPYMGTYRLDGKAGTGSHPAVDIKLLMNTPIVSIANGVVTDVQAKQTGFGKYVVIRHDNVPDLENPGRLTSYFSSYSHLDEFVVEVGDTVSKGELIGYNGNTGTSTTPHVHFQIDTIDAPFHPYWPFTWQEAQDAGLSFYEAVNSGLGKENGERYTINPMEFVQANLNFVAENSDNEILEEENEDENQQNQEEEVSNNPFANTIVDLTPSEETIVIDTPKPTREVTVKDDNVVVQSDRADISFETPKTVLLGEEVELVLSLNNNNLLASAANINNLIASSERADLTYSSYLSDGENIIDFRPRVLGKHVVSIDLDGQTYESEPIDVRLFNDVASDDIDILKLTALKKAKILRGENGNMSLFDEVNRAESLTFLTRTIETAKPGLFERINTTKSYNFDDVSKNDWFERTVRKAIALGSVDPERASFDPAKSVNLPELLKMYFEAMDADIDFAVNSSYGEYFDTEAWYAPYLQEALSRNIITTEEVSSLDRPLTRRDVSVIAFKFLSIIETGRYVY